MMQTDRRGESVAALGAFVSLAGFVVLSLLGTTNTSLALYAAAWHLLGGLGVWILILVQLHQHRLVEQEKFELAELERERLERLGGARTIFEEEDAEQMDALAMGRRLRTIEKWFVPIFAMVTAAVLATMGLRMFPGVWPFALVLEAPIRSLSSASMLAFFAGGVAFVTFALSRYALGMSRVRQQPKWVILRAGGAYFFGVAVVGLLTAIALVLAHNGYEAWERGLGRAIGVLMIFLAAEIVLNFVLDLYRPRVPGQEQRVFYESRSLSIFSEPEGIIRSAAQTIDYQFGFKVSETWFYQLLGRAVVPLILFQALVLYLITCFVVVPQGHRAVVEHLGFGRTTRAVALPGIHFTWPWPFARATLVPVDRIQRLELGYDPTRDEKDADHRRLPILWTTRHRAKEYALLVADRSASAAARVPVNLLSVTMPIQWRVKADRVLDYHRQAADVAAIIEALGYRALTQYAAHADLLELMGEGGIVAARAIHQALQRACDTGGVDGGDLGVEIVHVGLGSVHPPVDVAESYEKVINAFEQKDTRIKEGEAHAAKTRISAAGERYLALYEAIVDEERALAAAAPDAADKTARVERMLREMAAGTAREKAAAAEEYFYRRVMLTGADAERFRAQRDAFERAPDVYMLRTYLETMISSLAGLRKYVIAVDRPELVLYQFDLKPPPPLELLQSEVQAFQESGRNK